MAVGERTKVLRLLGRREKKCRDWMARLDRKIKKVKPTLDNADVYDSLRDEYREYEHDANLLEELATAIERMK